MPITDERMAVITGVFIALYVLFLVIGTMILVGWFFVREFMLWQERKRLRSSSNAGHAGHGTVD